MPELLETTGFYYFMQNLPKRIPKRIVLYAKDVENITGKKARTASNLLQRIRKQNKKPKNAFVTVKEFCSPGFMKMRYANFCLIKRPP